VTGSWDDSGVRTGPHEIGLIAKIAATSDEDAARRLYRKYRKELFRFGFHVLHDQGLAEEMVQETFIKFCQQSPNYQVDRGPVRGWLFTMALDKLPSIYGDVMRLVRDGFTHSEIAERLGIPIGTVKSRMARAADTLRAELASLRGSDDAL
jgi:RNA polymerase sigma-70 factor, ECF subfamily